MEYKGHMPIPERRMPRREALGLLAGGCLAGFLAWKGMVRDGPTPKASLTRTTPDANTPTVEASQTSIGMQPESTATPVPLETPIAQPFLPTPTIDKKETIIHKSVESVTIDGLETFGEVKPLTSDELTRLYEQLNNQHREMRPDTYYATMITTDRAYRLFQTEKFGSFQNFLQRNADVFNQMFRESGVNYPTDEAVVMRRLLVVADDAKLPSGPYDLHKTINDSDGGWYFGTGLMKAVSGIDDKNGYNPTSAGYDGQNKISLHLLHELAHGILDLNDEYFLRVRMTTSNLPEFYFKIPNSFARYEADARPDISNGLMGQLRRKLGKYASLQLLRRVQRGSVHEHDKYDKEVAPHFPNEIPATATLQFGDKFTNADIEIYRSYEVKAETRERALKQISKGSLSAEGSLHIDPKQIFPVNKENMINAGDGVLLLRILTKDGNENFRWMDIRDFNIAHWEGHTEHADMHLKLFNNQTVEIPQQFDWEIKYQQP